MDVQAVTGIDSRQRVFRVTIEGREFSVMAQGRPYVWTCGCRDFFNGIRKGEGTHCIHITACIDSLRTDNGREIPGVICPYGNRKVITRMHKGRSLYRCCACNMNFRMGARPARRTLVPSPVPLSDSGTIPECPRCLSTTRTKAGKRDGRQIFKCKECGFRYILREPGSRNTQYSQDMVSAALNKVMSGMSYRKIAEDLRSTTGMAVAHNTIIHWAKKYTRIIKAHLDTILPMTGPVWSVDEAFVNVRKSPLLENKGNGNWLWSAIDPKTRFLLCTRIAEGSRKSPDAEAIIEEARRISGDPEYMVTDSMSSYDAVAARNLPGSAHIKTLSIRDGFTNMAVERWHNEIREKLKSCRGLHAADSAQIFMDLMRIHHNYVRPHMGLGGRTPAEESGISDPGVKDKKYGALIRASSATGAASSRGRHSNHVEVVNRGDIIVTPKKWVENGVWKEINHILSKRGFKWLFTQVVRGWILFENAPEIETVRGRPRRRMPV